MKKSLDRGQPSKSSDNYQGRAGEFTRKLAKAQLGKGIRELSSPHTGLLSLIHISDEQSSLVVHRPRIVSLDADWYQSSEKRYIPKDISDSEFSLEKDTPLPLELHKPIFERVLAEKFLDIYENKHDRCAAIEFLEKSGEKSVARKFVEQLNDERLEKDPDTSLKMISAIGKLGDPSVVPELLNKLSSFTIPPSICGFEMSALYYEMYGAMAGVTVMLDRDRKMVDRDHEMVDRDRKSVVLELCEMLSDQERLAVPEPFRNAEYQKEFKCLVITYAIGMSGYQPAAEKLRSILSNLDINNDFDNNFSKAINNAIRMLESPSVESELSKVISDKRAGEYGIYNNIVIEKALPFISGKLGDILVANKLVEMFSNKPYNDNDRETVIIDKTPRAVEDIVGRIGNPKEIKDFAERFLHENDQEGNYAQAITKELVKAVSGLGKRLVELAVPSKGEGGVKLEDVKQLSKKIVAKLFSERIPQQRAPSIANAVFELEQHLAEPNPLNRILDPGKVRREACKNIKDEILQIRQNFMEEDGKVSSKFYEILSKAAFSNCTRKEMRIGVYYPIMKEAGQTFAPRLEKLATPQGRSSRAPLSDESLLARAQNLGIITITKRSPEGTAGIYSFNEEELCYDKVFDNEEGWSISKKEQQRMKKFAQYLRSGPSSSDAEHLSQ